MIPRITGATHQNSGYTFFNTGAPRIADVGTWSNQRAARVDKGYPVSGFHAYNASIFQCSVSSHGHGETEFWTVECSVEQQVQRVSFRKVCLTVADWGDGCSLGFSRFRVLLILDSE